MNGQASFIENWESIWITYSREINYYRKTEARNHTYELCELLYSEETVGMMGENKTAKCSYYQNRLMIELGNHHQFRTDSTIAFNSDEVFHTDCVEMPMIIQLEIEGITPGNENLIPEFSIISPSEYRPCYTQDVFVANYTNIGKSYYT